jgi:hypothetical protein
VRFDTEATLVHLDAEGKLAPWPDAMRARLQDDEAHDDT